MVTCRYGSRIVGSTREPAEYVHTHTGKAHTKTRFTRYCGKISKDISPLPFKVNASGSKNRNLSFTPVANALEYVIATKNAGRMYGLDVRYLSHVFWLGGG